MEDISARLATIGMKPKKTQIKDHVMPDRPPSVRPCVIELEMLVRFAA